MKRLVLVIALLTPLASAQFPDIPPGHYAESAVTRLVDLGVMTGYPDGFFRGQATIDRYQLSLILTRMWDVWSTAQLNDVWSEITSLELALARMRQEQALMRQELEQIEVLETRLARSEEAVTLLDTRTRDVGETTQAVGSINIELGRLREEITGLRTQLGEGGQAQVSVLSRLEALSTQLNQVQQDLDENRLVQGQRIQRVERRLSARQQGLEAAVASQQETLDLLTDPNRETGWDGAFTVAAGVRGENATYRVGADLETPLGAAFAEFSPSGVEARAAADVGAGIDVLGRYHVASGGEQGLAGVRFGLAQALSFSLLAGHDVGLAAGAVLSHDGLAENAALPGLTVVAGGLSGRDDFDGSFSRFLLQGFAGVRFGTESLGVQPGFLYRRETGLSSTQLLAGEVRVSFEQPAWQLDLAGRYGLVQDLTGGPDLSVPEAELEVSLTSGAFLQVELSGDLPDPGELLAFADGSPFLSQELTLGVEAGYRIPLGALR
jgi:hypothetical protein